MNKQNLGTQKLRSCAWQHDFILGLCSSKQSHFFRVDSFFFTVSKQHVSQSVLLCRCTLSHTHRLFDTFTLYVLGLLPNDVVVVVVQRTYIKKTKGLSLQAIRTGHKIATPPMDGLYGLETKRTSGSSRVLIEIFGSSIEVKGIKFGPE